MKKLLLSLTIVSCFMLQVRAEYQPMYPQTHYDIPMKMPSPQPIPNSPGLSEVISRKETYKPWAYYPIQLNGNGSTYLPGGTQPTSQGSGGNTYVLWQ